MPKMTRAEVEQAFNYFDNTYRNIEKFSGWEQSPENNIVIEHGGRLYPMMLLLRHISGKAPGMNYDMRDAVAQFTNLGFKVVRVSKNTVTAKAASLPEAFRAFAKRFSEISRKGSFGSDEELDKCAAAIVKQMDDIGAFRNFSPIITHFAGDKGGWSKSATLKITEKPESEKHRENALRIVYYVMPETMELLMTLELASDDAVAVMGSKRAMIFLAQSALKLRLLCQDTSSVMGFSSSEIEDAYLSGEMTEVRRAATIIHKILYLDKLSTEKEMGADLAYLIDLLKDFGKAASEARVDPPQKSEEQPRPRQSEKKIPLPERSAEGKVITDVDDLLAELSSRPPSEQIGESMYMPAQWIDRMFALLNNYGQMLLAGPAGTGKTHVARGLALAATQDIGRMAFFPATPEAPAGFLTEEERQSESGRWEIVDGPIKKMAHKASSDPSNIYVLVIDDVHFCGAGGFGESFFLMRNREESLKLRRSGDNLYIPTNLKIIATANYLNPARDAELMRLFPVVRFTTAHPPVRGVLNRWLTAHAPELLWLYRAVEEVNSRFGEENGVGPAWFMRDDLDERVARMIWDHLAMPFIEAKFAGDAETISAYEFDALKARLAHGGDNGEES